jgi:hypothetical protein
VYHLSLCVALEFVSLDGNSRFHGPAKFGHFPETERNDYFKSNVPTKYTLYDTFRVPGKWPKCDSTRRVRRLTGILRCARVKIFILAYGSFWFQLSEFPSNLTGHHETKTAKPIWSCKSKYSNFYSKPRLPITDEDVLNRFRTFRAV